MNAGIMLTRPTDKAMQERLLGAWPEARGAHAQHNTWYRFLAKFPGTWILDKNLYYEPQRGFAEPKRTILIARTTTVGHALARPPENRLKVRIEAGEKKYHR